MGGRGSMGVALILALAGPAPAQGTLDRARIKAAERQAEALSRRLGDGPSAARRTGLANDVRSLGRAADRSAGTTPGLGRVRRDVRGLERRVEGAGGLGSPAPGTVGGGRTRLLGIGIPETSLGLDALGGRGNDR